MSFLYPSPPRFFVRTPVFDRLLDRWHNGSRGPIFLLGNPGSGKTSVAQALVAEVRRESGDESRADLLPFSLGIANATEAVAKLTVSSRRQLLVLDGLDEFVPYQDRVLDNFISSTQAIAGASPSMLIITTRPAVMDAVWMERAGRAAQDFEVITLPPMAQSELDDLILRVAVDLSPGDRGRLGEAAEGSPLLAALLAHLAQQESVDSVLERLVSRYMLAVNPNHGASPEDVALQDLPGGRDIEVRLRAIDDDLIAYLADHPERLYDLRPRQFEELLAELYAREGFQVEMTKETRDGGIDLYLVRYESFGRVLTVVDAKRYRQDRAVSVGIVRGLYGVVEAERASAGVVATTSFFTREAKRFQESVPFRLSLQDYFDLQTMLRRAVP